MKPKILVTVSSELFSEGAIRRAAYLARRFEGELALLYVIEERVLRMIDRTASYALTAAEIERTEEEVLREIRGRAQGMLFERAALLARDEGAQIKEWEIVQGEYVAVLCEHCKRRHIDLVVLSHERAAPLGAQLFAKELPPLWIERGPWRPVRRVLAVASSLSPDAGRRLPPVALEFAHRLEAELHLRYVRDPAGTRPEQEVAREVEEFEAYCARELPKLGRKTSHAVERGPVERLALLGTERLAVELLITNRELEPASPGLFRRDPRRRLLLAAPCSTLFI